jgi:hypothetical protein
MELACSVFSPARNAAACTEWSECQEGTASSPTSVLGVPIPQNLLYVAPPGITLDNTWLANIAVRVRGLGETGEQMFGVARRLAVQSSVRWLRALEVVLRQAGADGFWQRLSADPETVREDEYERFDRFPYMFLSAGKYPPDPRETGEDFFLRVRLRTAEETGAGTDSDIWLGAEGTDPFLLDYMPREIPGLAHDDFQAGDNEVYTVGPFAELPSAFSLENRSANTWEVLTALGHEFVEKVEELIVTARDVVMDVVAGHADLVGTEKLIWTPEDLRAIGEEPMPFRIDIDGRDEGHYRVHGSIRRTAESNGATSESWAEYEVRLEQIECVQESRLDRFSDSDEPFVLALLVPLAGESDEIQNFPTEPPFTDVDTGEWREMAHVFNAVRVPVGYGMLSLPIAIWEHDDEDSDARKRLLDALMNKTTDEMELTRRGFSAALGAAIAADWKLAEMEVSAVANRVTPGPSSATRSTLDSRGRASDVHA